MGLNSKNIKKILLIVLCSAIIFALVFNFMGVLGFLGKLMGFVTPIIIALCIAFVLNVFLTGFEAKIFPFMKKSKHKIIRVLQRPLCLILTYALAIGLLALIVLVIIPDIRDTIAYIIDKLPAFIVESREWLIKTLEGFNIPTKDIPEIDVNSLMDTVKNLFSKYSTSIVDDAISITGSVVSVVSDILFGIIVSAYILAQKEKIGAFMKRVINSFLPEKVASIVHHVSAQTYFSFTRFIGGQLTESIILGVLCYIGMLIFRFPNAAIISIIICVTSLVPVVGALAGAVVGAFLILISDPIKAILFLVFLIILQQLEGNLIYPKVVGKAVGLPGVIVISAVLVGGNMGGVMGALIGVPLAAVIYTLLKEAMDSIQIKKQKEKEAAQAAPEQLEIKEATE
ncbi:MAG: AI-2E family transporter [Ruminococcaceae bacterium]|nr:AI-2E family transporter [Oscillospiraceae bacterium]